VLQPLVENAIVHGVGQLSTPLQVRIEVKQDSQRVRIRVENDCPAAASHPTLGKGLSMLQQMLVAEPSLC